MTAPPALLLFDLDGTLLDTGGVGQRIMRSIAQQHFDNKLDFDAVEFGGLLDPLIYAQAAEAGGLNHAHTHHDRFRDAYIESLRSVLQPINPDVVLPGVLDLLDALDALPQITTGLLTGNYREAGPIKLRHGGIDPDRFEPAVFGDDAPTRPEMVGLARQRYANTTGQALDPERVFVIGDTPRDIACAKAHGCHAFAVATGRFSVEALRATNADTVVEDLSDPSPLIALVG